MKNIIRTEIETSLPVHIKSGGYFEQYNIKHYTNITLSEKLIEKIKNNNISKKECKLIIESLGTNIVYDLFEYIKNEGI